MTVEEIKQLQEAFTAFKTANDQYLSEVAKYGSALGDTKAQVEKLQTALDKIEVKIGEVESAAIKQKAVEDLLAEFEAKLSRRGGTAGGDQKSVGALHREIFVKAVRTGVRPDALRGSGLMSADELKTVFEPEYMKALVTGNDTAGGYLAPLEFVAEMLKNVVEFSPVRQVARVRSTGRIGVQMPKRTTTAAASWVAETGTRSETTNPAFGMEEVRTHEMYAMTKVSRAELEDSAFDVEAFLREEFGEQFGLTEGTAFISGNAVGKPEGLMTNASVGFVVSGHATEITADGLIALYYEPKEPYIANGTFLLSRPTLKTIRQLKDGNGNYLWTPGIKTDARPATILDRPYLTCIDMPAIGAGLYPVLFGDIRRAYIILDRVVMDVMVDPYASKATGMVEFSARKRVGGQVILAEAVKKLKISV